MGLYLQPALGRAHPIERDSRSRPARARSVTRTIQPRRAAASTETFRTGHRLNLLDENFPKDQLPLLKEWHIPFRLIGRDLARPGVKDPDIIPLLHQQRGVTFFTLDLDFFHATLCHPAYGLVWLNVRADDAAHFVRRFLKHPRFNTQAQRMGIVARARHKEIEFWQRNRAVLQHARWIRPMAE